MESYGLPPGSDSDGYGGDGVRFPDWVYQLGAAFELRPSTYPGHQEPDRRDIGAAPNPNHLNRGIDWVGPNQQKLLDFAHWLRDTGPARTSGVYGPPGLEMVIYQDPRTGERVGYPSFVNYGSDYPNHTNHVHTRHSASMLPPGQAPPPPPLSKMDQYALAVIDEGRKRNISPKGIQIALVTPFVESGWKMYANSNVPGSEDLPHDAVGHDHDSTGLFQQRQAWGPLSCTMNAACSAGLFYNGGAGGQRGLIDFDYNSNSRTPGGWAQAVQVSAFPDRYDQHWNEAVDLYNRLADVAPPPQPGEDELSAEAERMIRELYDEYQSQRRAPTRSMFAKDMRLIESPLGYLWNIDANTWDMKLTWAYLFGVRRAVEYVERVARDGVSPQSWAGQLADEEGRWLSEFGQEYCRGLISFRAALQNALRGTLPDTHPAPVAPPIVYLPALAEPTPSTNGVEAQKGLGDVVKTVVDAVGQLALADALSNQDYATLEASIKILEMKNGQR